jgi:phosphatidylinositol N-acetylglucosaminyltransferase subunit H
LETRRGFLWWELSKSRTFLPFSVFEDLFINEALFGWNVRYYIAAKAQKQEGDHSLHVAFPVSGTL